MCASYDGGKKVPREPWLGFGLSCSLTTLAACPGRARARAVGDTCRERRRSPGQEREKEGMEKTIKNVPRIESICFFRQDIISGRKIR